MTDDLETRVTKMAERYEADSKANYLYGRPDIAGQQTRTAEMLRELLDPKGGE